MCVAYVPPSANSLVLPLLALHDLFYYDAWTPVSEVVSVDWRRSVELARQRRSSSEVGLHFTWRDRGDQATASKSLAISARVVAITPR